MQKQKTLVTMLEILAPLLFSAVVMYLCLNSLPRKRPPLNYLAINVSLLPDFLYFPTQTRYQIVYVPSKSEMLKAVTRMVEDSFDVEFDSETQRWGKGREGIFPESEAFSRGCAQSKSRVSKS